MAQNRFKTCWLTGGMLCASMVSGPASAQLLGEVGGALKSANEAVVKPVARPVGEILSSPRTAGGLAGEGKGGIGAPLVAIGGAGVSTASDVSGALAPITKPIVDAARPVLAPVASPATSVLTAATSDLAASTSPLVGGLRVSSPSAQPAALVPPRKQGSASSIIASGNMSSLLAAQPAQPMRSAGRATQSLSASPDLLDGSSGTVSRQRLAEQLRRHPRVLAREGGAVVVRGEVLAISVSATTLQAAKKLGFRVTGQSETELLGLSLTVLQAPRGQTGEGALRQLRALDPTGAFDLNHLYAPAGETRGLSPARAPAAILRTAGLQVGLIDQGVDARHASLRGVDIAQKAFAGRLSPGRHGLAIASLLIGDDGRFRGAGRGDRLFVADVYGAGPTGGSALAVTQALGWMAKLGVPVINVSLVGPPNAAVGAAIAALVRRGHLVVAASGNDGPAAGPLYPAAYPGVVAVTGVDAGRRVLPEAGRGPYISYAARGSDMAAAAPGGYVAVRGTSFAAPLVAAALAERLPRANPADARRALTALNRSAIDLGAPGPDPVYGYGLVAHDAWTAPPAVGARGVLAGF